MTRKSLRKITFLLFVCLLLAGAAAFVILEIWRPLQSTETESQLLLFQHRHHTDTDNLQSTLDLYVQTLFSARGFMMASGNVSRSSWQTYFKSIGTGKQLPGLGLLAYIEQVPAAQKNAFAAELHSDKELQRLGVSNITIHPDASKEAYQVAKYIEPAESSTLKSIIGFDFSSEETRRAAFEKSRDNNQATTTPPVRFYSNQKSGFVVMLPLYRSGLPIVTPVQRRDAYYGMVMISIRIKDIFDDSFIHLAALNTLAQVYDGTNTDSDNLIYQNMELINAPSKDLMSVEEHVLLADRTLTIKYTSLAPRPSLTLIPSIWGRLGILIATNLVTAWYVWTRIRTSKP